MHALDRLVQQQRLADILDLGNRAFEIECLGEDNLEDLWHGQRKHGHLQAAY